MIALAVVVLAATLWLVAALAAGIGLGRVIARADSEEERTTLPTAGEFAGAARS